MICQASLSHSRLVKSVALNEATHYSELLSKFRALHTCEVVGPAAAHGLEVMHDYESKEGAFPLPATLTVLLGGRITGAREGGDVRLYSDYPFPGRSDVGPSDSLETEALHRLRQNPDDPVYRFEKSGGRDVLRYATAEVVSQSWVACPDSNAQSPKKDWKVGDVRGVLEITLPMDAAVNCEAYSDDWNRARPEPREATVRYRSRSLRPAEP
jgi:hypothetical protein